MGGSSLNPYAASYVPMSKRSTSDEKKDSTVEAQNNNGSVWYGSLQENASVQAQHQKNAPQNYVQHAGASQTHEFSQLNDSLGSEFYASSSQYPNQADIDLGYLRMAFPDISEESLSDIYLAYQCDLDAAVDMLNQLEMHHDDDSLSKLPDTLDIGDVSEPGPSTELVSQKLRNVTAAAGTSTSGSLNSSSTS